MGPLRDLWAMGGERKHREGKSTANSVATRVNICKTIALKQQLIFSKRLLLNKGFDPGFSTGILRELSFETSNSLPSDSDPDDYFEGDKVRVYNTEYKIDFTIVVDTDDEFFVFAKIKKNFISSVTSEIVFICDTYKTISFCEHFFAYEVIQTTKTIFVKQADLLSYHPVVMHNHYNGKVYAITRSDGY